MDYPKFIVSNQKEESISIQSDKILLHVFQEAAYIKIHAEIADVLSRHACPMNTKIYPTWDRFLESFLSQGRLASILHFICLPLFHALILFFENFMCNRSLLVATFVVC